jgi:tyrosine-protein kinase
MTAEQVRNLLLKHAWLIAICTICTIVGALVGTAFMTPMYQSTVTLHAVVSPETPNTYALLVLDRFVGTEAQLASSPGILQAVAAKYHGETAQSLKSRVTAIPQQNTQLLQISVVDRDPKHAAALANSIAAGLIVDAQDTMRQRNLHAEQTVQQEIAATQTQIQDTTAKLSDPQLSTADAAALNAQLQSLQEEYKQYLETRSTLQVQDGVNSILLYVKTPATPDTRPVRPVILVNLGIGIAGGLLLGILLVLARAQLSQRLRDAEEVADFLGYPILVDMTDTSTGTFRGQRQAPEHATNPQSDTLYPHLQQSIRFLGIDRPIRSVALTGAPVSSKVAADWAVFEARHGRKVLLVDADLEHPMIAGYLGMNGPVGLSDAALHMAQGENSPTALQRYLISGARLGLPALLVMTAGSQPPNPGQVLQSKAMGAVFRTLLSTEPEIAFFTTPAGQSNVHASSLEANVDGVVVVVQLDRARKQRLARLKARLSGSGAHVLGIVVVTNKLDQNVPPGQKSPSPNALQTRAGLANANGGSAGGAYNA